MVEETTMAPEMVEEEVMAAGEVEAAANPEEAVIAQIIEMIAQLSAEAQRELMWFLNQQFQEVSTQEAEAIKESPEEQERKAAEMSEMF